MVMGLSPLDAPTGLSIGTITFASFILSFTASPGAATYDAYNNGVLLVSGITASPYTFSGLTSSTTYVITLKAVLGSRTSVASDSASATTLAPSFTYAYTGTLVTSTYNGYNLLKFTTSGTLTVSGASKAGVILLAGGGGGGGSGGSDQQYVGPGGGGGGEVGMGDVTLSIRSYVITVGSAGTPGQKVFNGDRFFSSNGGATNIVGDFTYAVNGGGRGGMAANDQLNVGITGGSGGGSSSYTGARGAVTATTSTTGTFTGTGSGRYANSGGAIVSGTNGGSGGGGAGGVGASVTSGTNRNGVDGGAGVLFSYSGEYYGGGGGGGGFGGSSPTTTGGSGGSGGGGSGVGVTVGSSTDGMTGISGTANTGGGGGASSGGISNQTITGGYGGTGVVVFAYA
jgi:hypothetical protein